MDDDEDSKQYTLRGMLFVLLFIDIIITCLYLGIGITVLKSYLYWFQFPHVINFILSLIFHIILHENNESLEVCNVCDFIMLFLDIVTVIIWGSKISSLTCGDYCWDVNYYYILFVLNILLVLSSALIFITRYQMKSAPITEDDNSQTLYSYKPLPILYIFYIFISLLICLFVNVFWYFYFGTHILFMNM